MGEASLSESVYKRLILSHHKNLVMGNYLIDDWTARWVDHFTGTHIHFGTEKYPGWNEVRAFLEGARNE